MGERIIAKSTETDKEMDSHPLKSNRDLFEFNVNSKSVDWSKYVQPLAIRQGSPLNFESKFLDIDADGLKAENKTEVFICHDLMGNYRDDSIFKGSQKFDDYRFYHWAGIDYFCYFSHSYITIPPPGWINAAHKHGVRAIGTYIVEHNDGYEDLKECLKSKEMVERTVDALVKLALHFKFEGWFLNIEHPVHAEYVENLRLFIDTLTNAMKEKVPFGCVFWYDSIVKDGSLAWQNEVNSRNVDFLKLSDGILLNYWWDQNRLENTLEKCENTEHIPPKKVFVGIDVFGRGQTAELRTGETLSKIISYGAGKLSTMLFAPSWVYENLCKLDLDIRKPEGDDHVNATFLQKNDEFFNLLWDKIYTHPYCQLPFYTDTCLGSGKHQHKHGQRSQHLKNTDDAYHFFNLLQQSLQPSVSLHEQVERFYEDAFNGGSCLRLLCKNQSVRLFLTEFPILKRSLVVAYAFKTEGAAGKFNLLLRIRKINGTKSCKLFLGDKEESVLKDPLYLAPLQPEHHKLLVGDLECQHLPKHLYDVSELANRWRVRYYVMTFDCDVQVTDVGMHYEHNAEAEGAAYLGGTYINQFKADNIAFPAQSAYKVLDVEAKQLV